MGSSAHSAYISVERLQVGMFIHLDLGWLSHPFPRSSFRIQSPDQLVQLRGLGVQQVRWDARRSEPMPPRLDPSVSDLPDGAPTHADPNQRPPSSDAAATPAAQLDAPVHVGADAGAVTTAPTFTGTAADDLQRQQTQLEDCQAQYAEASMVFSATMKLAQTAPRQAGTQAAALSAALVDKALVEGEVHLRLLNESAGERQAAHGLNVAVLSLLVGSASGLDRTALIDMGTGALLHDIGKSALPARVRHAPDCVTLDEQSAYQEHVARGVQLGRDMGVSIGALRVIGEHHEHADGSGFPRHLSRLQMLPGSRIVAIANRFDGLCNPVHAGAALTPHEALALLYAQGRTRYDAVMLGAFIRVMGVYPPGSLVQLSDDRYALVVKVNPSRPLKPTVRVHDPLGRADGALLRLQDDPTLSIRRSVRAQQVPPDALACLSPRPRMTYFFEPPWPDAPGVSA